MKYYQQITEKQRCLLLAVFEPLGKKLRCHDPFDVLEAIFYVIYTGCQWRKLPYGYPPWQTVYYHFRAWNASTHWEDTLRMLVLMKRSLSGQRPEPTMAVIDSQSVRTGLPQAVSGIDGGKRVKGIKRHIATDKNGYPLGVHVTTANVHDSKGAVPLIANTLSEFRNIVLVKADMGYAGVSRHMPTDELGIRIECVKSNFGTPDFIPIQGRWVVERTFSWLQNYRRLMRNYEQYCHTARAVTVMASVFFMLRYFA